MDPRILFSTLGYNPILLFCFNFSSFSHWELFWLDPHSIVVGLQVLAYFLSLQILWTHCPAPIPESAIKEPWFLIVEETNRILDLSISCTMCSISKPSKSQINSLFISRQQGGDNSLQRVQEAPRPGMRAKLCQTAVFPSESVCKGHLLWCPALLKAFPAQGRWTFWRTVRSSSQPAFKQHWFQYPTCWVTLLYCIWEYDFPIRLALKATYTVNL